MKQEYQGRQEHQEIGVSEAIPERVANQDNVEPPEREDLKAIAENQDHRAP